ncbi:MAG TPA: LacI family DNA-binding transcriptional regulator [Coriobacteriia bacterium]|nr:LacI family DNA-binding transcriptional regulator [Coriobacteriia bacterium]
MPATYHDIQRLTGLSLATISKFFNGGNVRSQNRQAIEAAVEELGYRVNEFARSLRTSKSNTVGVLLSELDSSFNTSIIARVEDILRAHGYGTIICDAHRDPRVEREAVEFLLGKMVDGVLAIPVADEGTAYRPALDRKVPVVLIDRLVRDLEADAVVVSNKKASTSGVDELVRWGHRRIALVAGTDDSYTMRERRRGFREALVSHGVEPVEQYLPVAHLEVQGGYQAVLDLLALPVPPTAVFCANYELTLGAVMALNETGTRVPDDVSLIGFDNLLLTKVVRPRPTMVVQPIERIADVAAELMLGRLTMETWSGSRVVTLDTTLVVGESVAAPIGALQ